MSTPPKLPRRSDSYEKQLSDGELLSLHASLLSGKESLKAIRAAAPPWRSGPLAGKPPSITTLHNIHERLVMEEGFRADEATTDSIIEELKKDLPTLTDAQLDELGQRTFSLMAIRRQDLKGFVQLRSARTHAEIERAKLKLKERDQVRQEAALGLEREKFETTTAEKFIDFYNDQRAKDIMDSDKPRAERLAQLRDMMFPDVPKQ